MVHDDLLDEEWIDDEGDDEDDLLLCPSCRASVHEDTQQCPHCGDWITPIYPGERTMKTEDGIEIVPLGAFLDMIETDNLFN